MKTEDVVRGLNAASHLLAAAADLRLIGRIPESDRLMNQARELLAFVAEMKA